MMKEKDTYINRNKFSSYVSVSKIHISYVLEWNIFLLKILSILYITYIAYDGKSKSRNQTFYLSNCSTMSINELSSPFS